jgi:acyl-CoA thioesterase-1
MNDRQAIRLFFFGDSICFGQGVAVHKGWVARISADLNEAAREGGREVMVSNPSINGNTTRQALERMPYDIQTQQADLLVVQFGMNDCNYWETDRGVPRVSPRAFSANMEEIINRAFNFGVRRVIVNTNHPTGRDQLEMPLAGVTYQQSNERYNQLIREVAAGFGERVVLNDIEASFKNRTKNNREALLKLVLPDLLHLSEAGHDFYFETVYPSVRKAVEEFV